MGLVFPFVKPTDTYILQQAAAGPDEAAPCHSTVVLTLS